MLLHSIVELVSNWKKPSVPTVGQAFTCLNWAALAAVVYFFSTQRAKRRLRSVIEGFVAAAASYSIVAATVLAPLDANAIWQAGSCLLFLWWAYAVTKTSATTLDPSSRLASVTVSFAFFILQRRLCLGSGQHAHIFLEGVFLDFILSMFVSCYAGLAVVYSVRAQSRRGLASASLILLALVFNTATPMSQLHSVINFFNTPLLLWLAAKLAVIGMILLSRRTHDFYKVGPSDLAPLLSAGLLRE